MKTETNQIKIELAQDNENLKSMDSRLRSLNQECIRGAFSPHGKTKHNLNQELDQIQESFKVLKLKQEERVDHLLDFYVSKVDLLLRKV